MKILLMTCFLVCSEITFAQTKLTYPPTLPAVPVTSLPSSPYLIAIGTGGLTPSDCGAGGGSYEVVCARINGAWTAIGNLLPSLTESSSQVSSAKPVVAGSVALPANAPTSALAGSCMYSPNGALNVICFGAKGDGTHDDAPNIQAAINTSTNSRVYLPRPASYYKIGSTLLLSNLSACRLEGDGTSESLTGSRIHWAGAANGTAIQLYSTRQCTITGLTIDGVGTSLGIGIDVTGANATGASHENVVSNVTIWDVKGTPGYPIHLGSATNDDIASNVFDHVTIEQEGGPYCAYQEGNQTVNNQFRNFGCFGYATKGMIFVAGDVQLYNANFFGNDTATADVEVQSGVLWAKFYDSYHEIFGSRTTSALAYSFPSGARTYETRLEGVRVLWGLASGYPIQYLQQGPFKFDGTIDGTGAGTVQVNNGNASSAQQTLIMGYKASNINYQILGNTQALIAPNWSNSSAWQLEGSSADNTHMPTLIFKGGTLATTAATIGIGNGGYSLQVNGGQAGGVSPANMVLDSGSGVVSVGVGTNYGLKVNGTMAIQSCNATNDAALANGQFYLCLTANTTLDLRAKGSDGTVRHNALTLQ